MFVVNKWWSCVCGSSVEVSSKNEWIIQEGENFCKGKLSVKQKQKNIRSILDSFLLKHFHPLPTLYYGNPATITNFLDYESPHSLYFRQYQIVSLTFKLFRNWDWWMYYIKKCKQEVDKHARYKDILDNRWFLDKPFSYQLCILFWFICKFVHLHICCKTTKENFSCLVIAKRNILYRFLQEQSTKLSRIVYFYVYIVYSTHKFSKHIIDYSTYLP